MKIQNTNCYYKWVSLWRTFQVAKVIFQLKIFFTFTFFWKNVSYSYLTMVYANGRTSHMPLSSLHCNLTGAHLFGKYICAEWARPMWRRAGTRTVCTAVPVCVHAYDMCVCVCVLSFCPPAFSNLIHLYPGVLCFGFGAVKLFWSWCGSSLSPRGLEPGGGEFSFRLSTDKTYTGI